MRPRFDSLQADDYSFDIDFKIMGESLVVTDFQVFIENDFTPGGWEEIKDKKRCRELFDKYGEGLILKEIEKIHKNTDLIIEKIVS